MIKGILVVMALVGIICYIIVAGGDDDDFFDNMLY